MLIMNNSFLYIEAHILCIVFAAVMLKFNLGSMQGALKYTGGILWMTMFASLADVLSRFCVSNPVIQNIFSIAYLSSFGIIGYLWLCYCFCQFGIKNRVAQYFALLPAIAVTVLVALSAKTQWIYYIDQNGVVCRGGLYYLVMINYVYVAFAGVAAVIASKKEKRKRAGQQYLQIAAFAGTVLISAVQAILLPDGFTTVTYAILLTLIMLYSNLQHKIMVTDNLTSMSNRYGMDAEIEEQLRQYRKDKNDSFYIIVCDIDNFKTINDTWGHPEGDRALKLIADALERVAQQFDSEAFRIGGDEFVVITDTSESGLADRVCDALEKEFDNIDFRDDFDINMSMGVSLYDGSCPISELISGADKKLYQAKRKNKEAIGKELPLAR
ncbi:MAG: GGDEF domain-containing protein [Clostridia bacterium]|nr:GGDEF domain-containing protein [Clostridia bacterium]